MLLILLLFAANIQHVRLAPSYNILVPKIIRPVSEYNILIDVENLPINTNITYLIKKTNGNSHAILGDTQPFYPGNVYFESLTLQTQDWTEGSYKLILTAEGGLNFTKSYDIECIYKRFIIMVQSDKAIYRPGEDVNFRIIVLDHELIPAQKRDIKDMTISIIDPNNFKLRKMFMNEGKTKTIKEIPSVNMFEYSNNGVTKDQKFNIPEEAPLGMWVIQTVTKGQVENYTFSVDYYSPALANITIDISQRIKYGDFIKFSISNFYTFGKPVQGQLEVSITKIGECGKDISQSKSWFNSTKINGQRHFQIEGIDALPKISSINCTEMNYNLSVKVTDDMTKSIYYNYQTFEITTVNIKAKISNERTSYRLGQLVQKKISLNTVSGEPVKKENMETLSCIVDIITNLKSNPIQKEATSVYKENGLLYCDFKTDESYVSMEILVVNQGNNGLELLSHQPVTFERGCVKDNIQVILLSKNTLKPGMQAIFNVSSTKPFKELKYYLVTRGSIALYKNMSFDKESIIHSINMDIDDYMVPEAIIVVYMKTKDNIILSDSFAFEVELEFHNRVNFKMTQSLVDAGNDTEFIVTSEPESRIFILATDVGLLAVKQGNDITVKRLLNELTADNKYEYDKNNGFDQSGMIVETNNIPECQDNSQLFAIRDMPVNHKNRTVNKDKIRKDFRETWIFDAFNMDSDNEVSVPVNVPDTITTWKVTGFSMNSDKGIGLTESPGYVTVFRNFFVKLSLPYTIKRKEISEMHLMVFNYLNKTVKAEINFKDNSTIKALKFKDCDQKIALKPNEIQTITCKVKSDHVGRFNITAEAIATTSPGEQYFDDEERTLNVIYEGIPQRQAKTVFFDLTKMDRDSIEQTVTIDFPTDHIKGTETVFLSATSELITVDYRDRISQIRRKFQNVNYDFSPPSGCCQQRISTFFNKVFWIQYMEATGRADKDNSAVPQNVIQCGIERLCPHNPWDGSYVYYGDDGTGFFKNVTDTGAKSFLWQTAYTLKMLVVAKKVTNIAIDETRLQQTINWIKTTQSATGEYVETSPEYKIFPTTDNAYLTAFVRAITYESGDLVNDQTDNWMSKTFDTLTNPLDIMVTCYALNMVKSSGKAHSCNDKILNIIQKNDDHGYYWNDKDNKPNLMITAYGLMILSMRNDMKNGLEVFKFLVSRQDPIGNFAADETYLHGMENLGTIISTEAMTKFVLLMKSYKLKTEDMKITFEQQSGNEVNIRLVNDDQVLYIEEGNATINKVKISGNGFGRAKATVFLQYNTWKTGNGKFNISVTNKHPNEDYTELSICTSYNQDDKINNGIVEIELPTGFKYHKDQFKTDLKDIDKIESKNEDTLIVIYLKEIPKHDLCLDIPVIESHSVDDRHPCSVKVYPFYNRGDMAVHHYSIK